MKGIRIDNLSERKLMGQIRWQIDRNKVARVRGGRSNADKEVKVIRGRAKE
jgi:hypothetical protein